MGGHAPAPARVVEPSIRVDRRVFADAGQGAARWSASCTSATRTWRPRCAALRALTGEGDSPGVDLVEVGMPYSDPMMDGVTIQRAGTRALQRGVRTRDAFAAVEAVAGAGTAGRRDDVLEPDRALRAGRASPATWPRRAGPGAITPDLTPDEAAEWLAVSDAHGLDRIFLVSPSSTDERLATHGRRLPRLGVRDLGDGRDRRPGRRPRRRRPTLVRRMRAADPEALVGVGLGVSNGVQAREVTAYADAVIVGSALVKTLLEAEDAGAPDDLTGLRAWWPTWPTAYGGRRVRRELPQRRRGVSRRREREAADPRQPTAVGDLGGRAGAAGQRLHPPDRSPRHGTRATQRATSAGARCPTRTRCPTSTPHRHLRAARTTCATRRPSRSR